VDIHAVTNPNDQANPVALTLSGAPAGVVIEVRMQNSLNGVETVYTGTSAPDGTLPIPVPPGFGGHFAFSTRAMVVGQADKIESFRRYAQEGDGIHFAQIVAPIATAAPTNAPAPAVSFRSVAAPEVK